MAEKTNDLEQNSGDLAKSVAGSSEDYSLEKHTDKHSEKQAESWQVGAEGATGETGQIRNQIEVTRREMGETIDAIQEKLSIDNISEQVKEKVSEEINNALETAKETVYEATIGNLGKAGKFMQNVGKELSKTEAGKFARKNPFPLVLIGLGAGLLAYELSGKNRRSYSNGGGNGKSRDYHGGRIESSISTTLKSTGEKIGDTANSAYESVSNATGNALHSVSDTATNVYESASHFAENAYEKVGDYSTQAREQYEYYIEENPLAVGAVALAIGAAVGLAIPSTQYEGQLMGETRENLLHLAQDKAGDLVDRFKHVTNQTQKTISEEVKTQGLTS